MIIYVYSFLICTVFSFEVTPFFSSCQALEVFRPSFLQLSSNAIAGRLIHRTQTLVVVEEDTLSNWKA